MAVASRLLGRGGGTALPGLVALAVEPRLVGKLAAQLTDGSVVVSGTNGKTTTSRILNGIMEAAGKTPLRNPSGSNLMRGVASSLVEHATGLGSIPRRRELVGLFEVDEAALPQVAHEIRPSHVLLLNLFRDQLDRYGEVATVARLWSAALSDLTGVTAVVANADDPLVSLVALESGAEATFFGIADLAGASGTREHASDVKSCPRCGGRIAYDFMTFGHLGHYRCDRCDFVRPRPTVTAHKVQVHGLTGATLTLEVGGETALVNFPLPGLYNVYNALGAAATATARGIGLHAIVTGIEHVAPAFGRMERMDVGDVDLYLALAKNPAGFNEVLRTITQSGSRVHLMVMLNDNIADGRDVSWIWDSDVEMLQGHTETLVFAGTRAEDMALRFKYAGVLEDEARGRWTIERDTGRALRTALERTPSGETLFVVPTYTALLDVRQVLTKMGYARAYWEND